jgi:uncharacterized damage-inducible protein DinB
MSDPAHADSVTTAKTRRALEAFLDDQRAAVIRKAAGVSDEDARRPMVPSGTSLAGILKHLAFVERYWFQEVFDGGDPEYPWTEDDPDADWRVEPWETVEGLVDFYEAEIERSRAITGAAASLKRRDSAGRVTLRWILLHMIEETARHAGHADILREQIDGATGV